MGTNSMLYGIKNVAEILGVKIDSYAVIEEDDAERCVRDAMGKGAEAIISGAMTVEIANKYGINTVLIESGAEAIRIALQEAVRTAQIARQGQAVTSRIKAILDYAYEGIIAIDEQGLITVFNKTAEEIVKARAETVQGKPISSILPQTGLLRVMETGVPELGELQDINGTMVAKNRVPFTIKGRVAGAVATFQNAVKLQELEGRIRKKIYSKGLNAKYAFKDIIGGSQAIQETIQITRKFSAVDSNLLLIGETGTGKELFAQSCHNSSQRRQGPFVAVNCAALPENLLESEFFGYVQGAFTGAAKGGKPGLFELAHQGTIFLDEVSEIPFRLQGRLLRVLQEREIMRLGDDRVIPVDVRVISATNKDLRQLSQEGRFREDLLYRLDVLHVHIPPLRERQDDIPTFFEHFMRINNHLFHKTIRQLSPGAMELLLNYNWPGNVRELLNICERLAVLAVGQIITEHELLRVMDLPAKQAAVKQDVRSSVLGKRDTDVSREEIQAALFQAKGNKTKAAACLGISRTTLWRKLTEIERDELG
jgi:transcriptional regulator with PAS, ATPase and Fis domain